MADFQGIFLSTPSARRATRKEDGRSRQQQISIHALREEGDRQAAPVASAQKIFYPRPPRGGRRYQFGPRKVRFAFLSTPSARRATCGRIRLHAVVEFLSTPSARRATRWQPIKTKRFLFLSTPSARRATFDSIDYISNQEFLSTPSARRATGIVKADAIVIIISIHALREEGDPILAQLSSGNQISIHALREEGDR